MAIGDTIREAATIMPGLVAIYGRSGAESTIRGMQLRERMLQDLSGILGMSVDVLREKVIEYTYQHPICFIDCISMCIDRHRYGRPMPWEDE